MENITIGSIVYPSNDISGSIKVTEYNKVTKTYSGSWLTHENPDFIGAYLMFFASQVKK